MKIDLVVIAFWSQLLTSLAYAIKETDGSVRSHVGLIMFVSSPLWLIAYAILRLKS